MDDDRMFEEALREGFREVRARDEERAPSFQAILRRAREEAADPALTVVSGKDAPPSRAPRRLLRWGAPMAAAAVLATLLVTGDRHANREFDRLVNDWSRTAQVTLRSPTDGLLTVPGSEYLRSVPAVGSGAPRTATPSPRRP